MGGPGLEYKRVYAAILRPGEEARGGQSIALMASRMAALEAELEEKRRQAAELQASLEGANATEAELRAELDGRRAELLAASAARSAALAMPGGGKRHQRLRPRIAVAQLILEKIQNGFANQCRSANHQKNGCQYDKKRHIAA